MKIRFWGVRGSIPTPMSSENLKSKISSAVQRIKPEDLVSQDSRELFLAKLPDYLFTTVGGNTSCVEVESSRNVRIIFDGGTGIRELGMSIAAKRKPSDNHIFFSHFHWDHIQGLPFFAPSFDPESSICFYSPNPEFRRLLEKQMQPPFFPVTMDVIRAKKEFIVLDGSMVRIGDIEISYRQMNHPGGCYSYMVREKNNKLIYSTDTELVQSDFEHTAENSEYFGDADAMIIDAQYTLGEAIEKYNWGHSSFSMAADFAANWGIKRIILFHHEPSYTDRKIFNIFTSAEWYIDHMEGKRVEVILAREGMELEI